MFFLQKQDSPKVQWDHHLSALKPPRLPRKKKNNFLHWIQTHNDFARHLFELVVNPFEPKKNWSKSFLGLSSPKVFGLKRKNLLKPPTQQLTFQRGSTAQPHPEDQRVYFLYTVWVLSKHGFTVDFHEGEKAASPPGRPTASASFLSMTWANWSFAPFFSECSSTCHGSETRKMGDKMTATIGANCRIIRKPEMVGILGGASLTKPPFQNIQLNDKAGICT